MISRSRLLRQCEIAAIRVYQCDLPLKEGTYRWSGGKSVNVFDSTIVELVTNHECISGWGETCTLGPFYLPSYAKGVRTGIEELAPSLLGQDPTKIGRLNDVMDKALRGHPYVKSAIDMACWDILGKKYGLPVSALLGGATQEPIDLYRAISMDSPENMAISCEKYMEEGYRKFQLKLGDAERNVHRDIARIQLCAEAVGPECTLIGDANTGWLPHEARRVLQACREIDWYIEQPCATYEECLNVRQHCALPLILDECIEDLRSIVRAYNDKACDGVNIKIAKFGGLTKAVRARDLAAEFGLCMTLEDSWGGDIVTAAIMHLAHSTPAHLRLAVTDFNSYNEVSNAKGGPQRKPDGTCISSRKSGLGVTPRREVLKLVKEFHA